MKKEKFAFENQAVQQIMDALLPNITVFEERKQGPAFKAIVLTVAGVFPEDRFKIYNSIGASVRRKETKPGGGATIYRGKSLEAVRKRGLSGCDNCPDYTASDQVPGSRRPANKKATVVATRKPKVKDVEKTTFETIEEILDTFQGSANAIIAWAQANDIAIPSSVSRADTAAKHVLQHFQSKEEEE